MLIKRSKTLFKCFSYIYMYLFAMLIPYGTSHMTLVLQYKCIMYYNTKKGVLI